MSKEAIFQVGQVYEVVDRGLLDIHSHTVPNHNHQSSGLGANQLSPTVMINGANTSIYNQLGIGTASGSLFDGSSYTIRPTGNLTIVHIEPTPHGQKLILKDTTAYITVIDAEDFKDMYLNGNKYKLNLAKTLEQIQSNVTEETNR